MKYIGCFQSIIESSCGPFASVSVPDSPLADLCDASNGGNYAVTTRGNKNQTASFYVSCCSSFAIDATGGGGQVDRSYCQSSSTSNTLYYSVYAVGPSLLENGATTETMSNATFFVPASPLSKLAQGNALALQALIIISALVFLFFICFTAYQNEPIKKKLTSPFNIQLFITGISTVGMFTGYLALVMSYTELIFLQYLSLAIYETFTLQYSWSRSHSVVSSVFSMTFYNVIKTFVYLSPIALLPQFIPSILVQADVISKNKGKLFTGVLTGTAAGFTITFDAILLYSFIKYVRDMENVSAFLACPRLVIVSRYGIFATSFGILAVILFSLSYAFKDELVQTVGIVSFAVLEVLYCVLVGMKVSLHVNHIRETSRKESAIEHARMISGGGRASGSVKTPSASQG